MLKLFVEGGVLFMSMITVLALIMLYFAVKAAIAIWGRSVVHQPSSLYYVRFFGMLALVTGVFGQMIGLYEAMKHISEIGAVSQAVLAGGLKVSSITTLYGFLVFVLAHIIWFLLDIKAKSASEG